MIIEKVTTTKVFVIEEGSEIAPDILLCVLGKEKTKRNLAKNICQKCGKVFYTRADKKSHSCSAECEMVGKKESFCCANCGAKLERYRRFVDKNKTGEYFCSRECQRVFYRKKRTKHVFCKECGKTIAERHSRYFCSRECHDKYKAKSLSRNNETDIVRWKNGEISGNDNTFSVRTFVKRYMLSRAENKCSKCGWSEENSFTKRVPLQIHHIDGDASNTIEANLEVLCPNCHSLTENYGSRNKNSVRVKRRITKR